MKQKLLFVAVVLFLVFAGCENSSDVNSEAKKIKGMVKDSQGNFISDANIFIKYEFETALPKVSASEVNHHPVSINSVVLDTLYVQFEEAAITIHWRTLSETNNRNFEVQKKSGDAFVTVGTVDGAGTSSTPHDYSFSPKISENGVYTCRIKINNNSGQSDYTRELNVIINFLPHTELIQNYPNPFEGVTTITFGIRKNCNISFDVLDINGKTVISDLWSSLYAAGMHKIWADFNHLLSTGAYKYVMKINEDNDSVYSLEKEFFINSDQTEPDVLYTENVKPNTVSTNGLFELSYDQLPLGRVCVYTKDDPTTTGEPTVKNDITIIVTKEGFKPAQKRIHIDQNRQTDLEFVLEKE